MGLALFSLSGWMFTGIALAMGAVKAHAIEVAPNTLSPGEKEAGWQLLFDGKSMDGWRKDLDPLAPTGWGVNQGAMIRIDGSISTVRSVPEFDNFELSLEAAIPARGDGGIFIRAWDDSTAMYHRATELQLIDNWRNPDAQDPAGMTGACAWLYPPIKDMSLPEDQFNLIRIVAQGPVVEHWMNGEQILRYEIGTKDWQTRVSRSGFANKDKFGRAPRGYIGFQCLGGNVRYRTIKIRPLADPSAILPRSRRPGSLRPRLQALGPAFAAGAALDLNGRTLAPDGARLRVISVIRP